jgi:hypothetical protein
MQRRVGLNDDGLARGVLEILDQGGLARLQGLGDFRTDAEGPASCIMGLWRRM